MRKLFNNPSFLKTLAVISLFTGGALFYIFLTTGDIFNDSVFRCFLLPMICAGIGALGCIYFTDRAADIIHFEEENSRDYSNKI